MWEKIISAAEVAAAVAAAGRRIRADHGDDEIVLLGLLQGGVFLLSDLARAVPGRVRVATLTAQSYGGGLASSGAVRLGPVAVDIAGRHVIVVDDIYDSGRTLYAVSQALQAERPRSLAIACLLDKQAPRAVEVEVRYRLFTIPNRFVVGCGLDLDGLGRNLPDVWALAETAAEPGLEQLALRQLLTQLLGGTE